MYNTALKIILGSAGIGQTGFLSTDKTTLDILDESSFSKICTPCSVEVFLAEHVWEHLSPKDGEVAARNCFAHLKPGGNLRLAVPDGLHPDPDYIEWVRPGGRGDGASDHQVLYDYRNLTTILRNAGFSSIRLLEWWDEQHVFHEEPWRVERGFIRRSRRHDRRNTKDRAAYTSLIVDAFKEPPGAS